MTNSNATPTDPNSLKQNKRLVDKALEDILVPGLTPFIKREMKRAYKNDWLQKARQKLQHYHFDRNGLKWADPQALLQLLDKFWDDVFRKIPEFNLFEKGLVTSLWGIRNQVSHNDFEKYNEEFTKHVLYNMELLLTAVPNEPTARKKAQEVRKVRENFSLRDKSQFEKPSAVSLQTDDNPFIPQNGRVEDPKLFFDREKNIRNVFELLNSGSSVAVIGDREIGKSSLLWAIGLQAKSKLRLPRKPIYIDLQDISDEDDFYSDLCSKVGIEVCKGSSLSRALKKHRLLVLIDEIEKMTGDGFTYQVRDKLRSLSQGTEPPLRLVVAASTPLNELFPDNNSNTSPLDNICHPENINVWDEATVREFISHRLALGKTPIRFQEDDIAQIVRESGGHPKGLMNLCHTMYKKYKENMS